MDRIRKEEIECELQNSEVKCMHHNIWIERSITQLLVKFSIIMGSPFSAPSMLRG